MQVSDNQINKNSKKNIMSQEISIDTSHQRNRNPNVCKYKMKHIKLHTRQTCHKDHHIVA